VREREGGLSSSFGFPPSRNCEDDPGGRRTNVCRRTILYVRCPTFPLRLSVALPLFLVIPFARAAVSRRTRGLMYPSAASRAPPSSSLSLNSKSDRNSPKQLESLQVKISRLATAKKRKFQHLTPPPREERRGGEVRPTSRRLTRVTRDRAGASVRPS